MQREARNHAKTSRRRPRQKAASHSETSNLAVAITALWEAPYKIKSTQHRRNTKQAARNRENSVANFEREIQQKHSPNTQNTLANLPGPTLSVAAC